MRVLAVEKTTLLVTNQRILGPMTHQADTFGKQLHTARERSGVTLRDIADATKLSVRNLTLLEQDRVKDLPGGIYRRAIVRAYAAHVGLDPEQTLRAFLVQHPDDVPTWADLVPPAASSSRRALHALVSVMGALIPMLAGVFYFSLSADGSDATQRVAGGMPRGAAVLQASIIPTPLTALRTDEAVAMMVSLSAPTALQIVADGREVAARRFNAGEVIRVALGSDVVLVGDSAGAVHFSINGRAGRTLGAVGEPLTARISRADYQTWLMQP